ncbi:ICAL protein, partial [Turnix velox]|nr:ICAL protein [Turnix velox]
STQAKSQTSPSVTTASKPNNTGKVTTTPAEQPPPATSTQTAKPKSEKMSTGASPTGGDAAGASVVAVADKSSTEPGMDELALDSLIDTLGGPEEDVPPTPVYTGPEVMEGISSRYLEELGKRESSLPPEYVKLLKVGGLTKKKILFKLGFFRIKPMTDDELAEALSSDFTCPATSAEEKKTNLTEKTSKEGKIVQAQAASSVKTSVPLKEKKTQSKEEIKQDVMEALLDTLGEPAPEPEKDLTPVVEVSEAKAKEKKEEKAGERDDAIPPEYRFTPELDKDGKPILPKPEEKPKALSESDLVDEFSKDFSCPAQPAVQAKPSKPSTTSKKLSAPVSSKAAEDEVVPHGAACTVQSSAPLLAVYPVRHAEGEALDALSSSLGKREPDPEEKKAAVDKVKVEKQNLRRKQHLKNQAIDRKTKKGGKPTESSEVISAATVSSVHLSAPLTSTSGGKEMDEALDLLSDSLGQREPDPDENKPVVDKVKEKAKSEHRDKLGERDDTIPPDYRKLLESGEQGKAGKPTVKDDAKHKEQKKPTDDSAAIDALSGDFDTCAKAPATPQPSKDKSGKETVTTKPTPKEKGKPKDSKKAKGQSSGSKSEKQKTS